MTSFDQFLSQAWSDHANDSPAVAGRIGEALALLEKEAQLPPLAALATHIFGEHLGRWPEGIRFLQSLRSTSVYESGGEGERAIARSVAALELAAGQEGSVDRLPASDHIRALATAAAALSGRKQPGAARLRFEQALALASPGLESADPANRALAITGNNMACALEELVARSPEETELMLLAARTARKFWGIAGSWLETERAEYRLSQSCRKAGLPAQALEHARACLAIVEKNDGPALERFFAFEALALAEKAGGNQENFSRALAQAEASFNQLTPADQEWCRASLEQLRQA